MRLPSAMILSHARRLIDQLRRELALEDVELAAAHALVDLGVLDLDVATNIARARISAASSVRIAWASSPAP